MVKIITTDEQIMQLAYFFDDRTKFSYTELIGFMNAIVSGSRVVPYTDWQDFLLNGSQFNSQKEKEEILTTLMQMYNQFDHDIQFADSDPFSNSKVEKFGLQHQEARYQFMHWVAGFCLGMMLIGNDWVKAKHHKALNLLLPIVDLHTIMVEDPACDLGNKELNLVTTNAKLLYYYWAQHRANERMQMSTATKNKISGSKKVLEDLCKTNQ